jgi:hypothetical protein
MADPVQCSRCGQARYPKGAYATPYVCKRCLDAPPPKPEKAPAPSASGDPFYSDLERRRAVNEASSGGRKPWLTRRPGWLRRA